MPLTPSESICSAQQMKCCCDSSCESFSHLKKNCCSVNSQTDKNPQVLLSKVETSPEKFVSFFTFQNIKKDLLSASTQKALPEFLFSSLAPPVPLYIQRSVLRI